MLDHAQLEALLAIEREGGFVRAADRLGLSRSALSDRIKFLEERVGVALVKRTRPVEMTGSGVMLCRFAETIEQLEVEVLRAFSIEAALVGGSNARLRVLVDPDSLATWFLDVLVEEAGLDDPRLFALTLADQGQSLAAMRDGHALTAISTSSEPIHGYKSRMLGTDTYRAVASGAFVDRWLPDGPTLDALGQAPCVCRDPRDALHREWMEAAFGDTRHAPTHVVPSARDAIEACRRGAGWMLAPARLVDEAIARGDLRDLVPDTPLQRSLYWHVSLLAEKTIQPLSRRVVLTAQRYFAQDGDGSAEERRGSA